MPSRYAQSQGVLVISVTIMFVSGKHFLSLYELEPIFTALTFKGFSPYDPDWV